MNASTLAVKIFGERQLEIFRSWGNALYISYPRSKYWLDKDFAFVRVFVRYALRARRATKALRCFTILTLTLFLRCIFQIPPCVNRKIVANAKCSWHVCASSLRCQFFSDIFTKNRTPCPRKSLGWGVVAGSCWIVLKTAVKRDAVLCGATCRKIFVFPTYESVA